MKGVRGSAAALALALACATGDAPPGRTVLVESPSEAIVVLPLNVSVALPESLAAASPRIWQELARYLRAHGATLKTLSLPAAQSLWQESIREARAAQGPKAGFDEAVRIFVPKIAAHAEFDTVLMPTLFVQGAEVDGWKARWDGSERRFEIDEGAWAGELGDEPPFGGEIPAASLHVAILDAHGGIIQQRQAGLVLLARIRVRGRPGLGPPRLEVVDLPEPLADRDALLEGIARALAPFLTELPPSAVPEDGP